MENRRIGVELRALDNLIKRHMERASQGKELDAATGTNGWIIGFLAGNQHKDIFQRDLEAEFGITRSTASKVVALMEKKGLIRREMVPQDARLRKLSLTPRALELSEIMYAAGTAMEQQLLKGFSADEIDQLYQYISRMKENIQ